jgi:hypothetical protein
MHDFSPTIIPEELKKAFPWLRYQRITTTHWRVPASTQTVVCIIVLGSDVCLVPSMANKLHILK